MPIFGEYETVQQISITEEPRLVTTVWKARKSGETDGRLYVIKSYASRPGRITPNQPPDELKQDWSLSFLEGIKRLKGAHAGGASCLAPVHAFGLTPEGAWFATDYYERRTLKEYIDLLGRVDNDALRQVVYSVVTGCLALKRSGEGKTHGNLKPSNVLLAGKPCPLRRTPLHLTDPRPAPRQLAALDTADQRIGADVPDKTMELQDLRAIGELILQLVEGRLLRNSYEYNYPVGRSDKWDKLGKTGESWRALCNRLLDPRASLEQLSLDNLLQQIPKPPARKSRVFAAFMLAIVVFGLGWLAVNALVKIAARGKEIKEVKLDKLSKDFEQFRENLNNELPNYLEIRKDFSKLLEQTKGLGKDPRVQRLREAAIEGRQYAAALIKARETKDQKDYDHAEDWVQIAKTNRLDSGRSKTNSEEVFKEIRLARTNACHTVSDEARQALNDGKYKEAEDKATNALSILPGDPDSRSILEQARSAQGKLREYDGLMAQGKALSGDRPEEAANKFQSAVDSLAGLIAPKKMQEAKQLKWLSKADAEKKSHPRGDLASLRRERDFLKSALDQQRSMAISNRLAEVNAQIDKSEASRKDADRLDACLRQAEQAVIRQEYDVARSNYLAVLKEDSANTQAQTGLAYIKAMSEGRGFKEKGEYTKGLSAFNDAKSARPMDQSATNLFEFCRLMLNAEGLMRLGKFQDATSELQQARRHLDRDPAADNAVSFVQLVLDGDRDYFTNGLDSARNNYQAALAREARYLQYVTNRLRLADTRRRAQDDLRKEDFERAKTNCAQVAELEAQLGLKPANSPLPGTKLVQFCQLMLNAELAIKSGDFPKASNHLDLAKGQLDESLGASAATALEFVRRVLGGDEQYRTNNFNSAVTTYQNACQQTRYGQSEYITNRFQLAKARRQAEADLRAEKYESAITNYALAWNLEGKLRLTSANSISPGTNLQQVASLALEAATNAWNQAERDFKQERYEAAMSGLDTALGKCEAARKLKPGAWVEGLKRALEDRRTAVQMAHNEKGRGEENLGSALGYDPTRLGFMAAVSDSKRKDVALKTRYGSHVGRLQDIALDLATGKLVSAFVASGSGQSGTRVPPGSFIAASARDEVIVIGVEKNTFSSVTNVPKANWTRLDASSLRSMFRQFGQQPPEEPISSAEFSSGTDLIGRHLESQNNEPLGQVEDLMVDLPKGRVVFLVVKPDASLDPDGRRYVLPPASVRLNTNGGSLVLKASRKDFGDGPHLSKEFWRTEVAEKELAASVYQHYAPRKSGGRT